MTPTRHSAQNRVVIVGGGHVGLSFALLLAHHGVYSTLIESSTYPKLAPNEDTDRRQYLDCRNTALSRKSVQIYQKIGLWESLKSHACRIDEVHISELGSFGKASLKKAEEGVESFGFVMENAWLGRQLLQAVKQSPWIQLLDSTRVTHLSQDDDQVVITAFYEDGNDLNDDNNIKIIHASVVVACDGQHSPIRHILGVECETHDYNQVGIVGVVKTDQAHQHIAIERFSQAGPLAVLPLPDDTQGLTTNHRRSVVFICPKGEQDRYLTDDEYFLQTLQQVFGGQAGKFLQAGKRGAYPLARVIAKKQVVGRCVLMGNAAHTLHPVAGQGFNLCLRDANALAEVFAHIQQCHGAESDFGDTAKLLAYEQARQKDQKRVINFCDTVVGSFTHKSPLMKVARNIGLLAFDKIPGIKPLVATYAMGLKS